MKRYKLYIYGRSESTKHVGNFDSLEECKERFEDEHKNPKGAIKEWHIIDTVTHEMITYF
jgi:hypothetical protein